MDKMIRSWASPLSVNEDVITGLGLVWFNELDSGTMHEIGPNQWEALHPQATITHHRSDVIAAFNHDFSKVLGRQSNNTLQLKNTSKGLQYSIHLNSEDPEHRSIAAKIKRGDVYGSSATFFVSGHQWTETKKGDVLLYTQIELVEVGPVVMAAMTSSTARVAASDQVSEYTKKLAETRKRLKQPY